MQLTIFSGRSFLIVLILISSCSSGPYPGSKPAFRTPSPKSVPPPIVISSSRVRSVKEIDLPISNEVNGRSSKLRFIAEKENQVDTEDTTFSENRRTVPRTDPPKVIDFLRPVISYVQSTSAFRLVTLVLSLIIAPYLADGLYGQTNNDTMNNQF